MTDTTAARLAPTELAIMEIPATTASPGVVATCIVLAGRTIRSTLRTRKLVVITAIQTVLFLAIFRFVFGGAIGSGVFGRLAPQELPYIDFLVPGYVVGSALFSGAGAAAGVAQEVEQGFTDRLLSLPIPRIGLVAGRSLADTVLLTWGMAMATAMGFLVGFRIHGGVPLALAAFGLCIVYGFAFSWVFISIGLLAKNAQVAQGISMMIFPLMTVSSAIVPVDTMPGWLQPVANNQPITAMTNAVRSLVLGDASLAGLGRGIGYWVLLSLVWCGVLLALFVPVAVGCYRRS